MFRIIPEGKNFSEYVLLRDGESVLLRTATPADVPAVEALMQSVSRESLQMRFMGAVAYVAPQRHRDMCAGEPRDRLSLLAIEGRIPGAVVAMGNYVSLGVGRESRGRVPRARRVPGARHQHADSRAARRHRRRLRVHRFRGRGALREPGDDQRLPRLGLRGLPGGDGRQPSRASSRSGAWRRFGSAWSFATGSPRPTPSSRSSSRARRRWSGPRATRLPSAA